MKVLSVASEAYPLIKTGGLADVVGALPAAIRDHGVDMRVLLPGYRAVMSRIRGGRKLADYPALFGGDARLIEADVEGLHLFVLDAPHLYDRPGSAYLDTQGVDWPDNADRFAALGRVAGWIGEGRLPGFIPDVVHAHDWQAGLAPAYLRFGPGGAKSVMTVHNIAFQGHFSAATFVHLGLPDAAFDIDGIEYYGGISFLKAGLQLADAITTVSPTYAREIATPDFGMGMDGLIRHRAAVVHGIVNGIDTAVWNPATDALLPARYSRADRLGKSACRAALMRRFDLTGAGPVLGVVTRLTWQKGMDVLAATIDEIVAMGCSLALLGSGEQPIETGLIAAMARHPGRVGIEIGYDEPLAHLIQAGSDAILVPSRFEPCGLTQLCALAYGTIPVVARTGGLADTVIDANAAAVSAGVATGIQFAPVDGGGLTDAIRRLLRLHGDAAEWSRLTANAMAADVGWTRSAARYRDLYTSLL